MERFSDVRNGGEQEILAGDVIDEALLLTLTFNERTNWKNGLVDKSLPGKIIELGKVMGLGIEEIHHDGILGSGTIVAIIDQPMDIGHPEYKDKIIAYKDFSSGISFNMHGPAVTSLLVGDTIGVAPGAKVIYAAVPTWESDTLYEVKALEWIIEQNRKLPDSQKIKFVSVSAAPSSENVRKKNTDLWGPAVKRASLEGIEVIDCTQRVYHVGPAYYGNIYDKNNFESMKPGFPDKEGVPEYTKNEILVPTPRTVAEAYGDDIYSYAYWGVGGLSWGIPFLVGTLLLGSELNKSMSAKDLIECLYETRHEKEGFYYINPKAFLELVKKERLADGLLL